MLNTRLRNQDIPSQSNMIVPSYYLKKLRKFSARFRKLIFNLVEIQPDLLPPLPPQPPPIIVARSPIINVQYDTFSKGKGSVFCVWWRIFHTLPKVEPATGRRCPISGTLILTRLLASHRHLNHHLASAHLPTTIHRNPIIKPQASTTVQLLPSSPPPTPPSISPNQV